MRSTRTPPLPTDKEIQALLKRHRCPMAFSGLRTVFLGHIASPRMAVSPTSALAQAWGGELPEFESQAAAEELMQALLRGLWNRLSEHQSSRLPFRLSRNEVKPTRSDLLALTRTRAEELKGFVDGLFGNEDELMFPQKAHEAIVVLANLHSIFDGAAALLADESKPAPEDELKALLRNLHQLTIAADDQINKVVQSCKRARGQSQEEVATVMSRKMGASPNASHASPHPRVADDGPEFIESPLSQRVTRHGVSVKVDIYGDGAGRWILEVIDAENTSHVWDDPFASDQEALDEALRAIDLDPLEFVGRGGNSPLN
jgi:hypothetical protein